MTLIGMAVYDTYDNNRTHMTAITLDCLLNTVNFEEGHRLIIVDNNSCEKTQELYDVFTINFLNYFGSETTQEQLEFIKLQENVGTARAINMAWQKRASWESAIKIDNDVGIYTEGWLDILEECIDLDPNIGIIGLKRKDLDETPWNKNPFYRSTLKMLPHEKGQPWRIVEEVNHVIGTVQLYNPKLLEKIGYLYQMGGLYGFDDALACIRSQVAGFKNVFYPHIEIEHLDKGGTEYTEWKKDYGWKRMGLFNELKQKYMSGEIDIYHGPKDS